MKGDGEEPSNILFAGFFVILWFEARESCLKFAFIYSSRSETLSVSIQLKVLFLRKLDYPVVLY